MRPGDRPTRLLAALLADTLTNASPGDDVNVLDPFFLKLSAAESDRLAAIVPAAKQVSRETGVDPELLLGIAHTESSWQPGIVNTIGCVGLMQVCPSTARRLGLSADALKDPVTNLRAGAQVLQESGLGTKPILTVLAAYGGFASWLAGDKVKAGGPKDPRPYRDKVLTWASKLALMNL